MPEKESNHRPSRRHERASEHDTRDNERRRHERDRDEGQSKSRRHRSRERNASQSRSRSPKESPRRGRHRQRSRSRSVGRRDREDDGKRERRRDREPRRHKDRDLDQDHERDRHRERGRDRRSNRTLSPNPKTQKPTSPSHSPLPRSGPLPSQTDSFALTTGAEIPKPKAKPNFGTTGILAAASNAVTQPDGTNIVLKYHEPPEARKPSSRDDWRLFIFKGPDVLDTVELSARSCWLVGRELAVVDLAAEHPSLSKQHAVIQFRYIEKRDEFGVRKGRVRPYLIDLESGNGTVLNGERVEASRFVELRSKDVIKFGFSEREYVLMLSRD